MNRRCIWPQTSGIPFKFQLLIGQTQFQRSVLTPVPFFLTRSTLVTLHYTLIQSDLKEVIELELLFGG